MRPWHFSIDRGGTFTDVVATDPTGRLHVHKVLSENPGRYRDAAVQGIRDILACATDSDITIGSIRLGTTVATNALLERRGEHTVLVTSAGFRDVLRIGHQNRPNLFDLAIELPQLLYESVIEVAGRLDASGYEIEPLDVEGAAAGLAAARRAGITSCAIVLLHAYRNPAHELVLADLARRAGFVQVSSSHDTLAMIRMVNRGDTTVVDAYLSPLLRRYVTRFREELGHDFGSPRVYFMQSNGGLTDAAGFRGMNSILSGPAGGVVGMADIGRTAGATRLIGFDMGGTSTDVCLHAGEFSRRYDNEVAGVRIIAPMMDIHTIAAGGGSVLAFVDGRFQVGPASAGADPGPACYRRGGPPAVTDINVILGRIQPDYFPHVFGPNADQPLDCAASVAAFERLGVEIASSTGRVDGVDRIAAGFLRVAIEKMANAIKHVSIRRGRDAAGHALVCFGGAAGQHACLVADSLGMSRILVHPLAGVLSAWGIGIAPLRALRRATLERPFDAAGIAAARERLADLALEAHAELRAAHGSTVGLEELRGINLRRSGSDTVFAVDLAPQADMLASFERQHEERYGFGSADAPLVVESVTVEVSAPEAGIARSASGWTGAEIRAAHPDSEVRAWLGGEWQAVPLYRGFGGAPGTSIAGPAIVAAPGSTTVIEPGWRARVHAGGGVWLERQAPADRSHDVGTVADPVLLEVFNNLFMHVAEQMGAVLQNTAFSVNIKERLDFSCAVFDRDGGLVANAPHMPVHLGSMGATVRAVIERNRGAIGRGDAWLVNSPYAGGTHLPDLTVVSPVLDAAGREVRFWVASRAHHADIGGISPGSMPATSRRLDEEGVLFENFQVVSRGRLETARLREQLAAGPHPARNPDQNLADIEAQIAANVRGMRELAQVVDFYGAPVVEAYMRHVQDNAENAVRDAIGRLRDGAFRYELDNGQAIAVALRVNRAARTIEVDFTGTSAQADNNFNAPVAVTVAAVLYVFRTLVDRDIPLNEGCLKPVRLIVPPGSMLAPEPPAAVVAGNVETSQCIVDALYGALGIQAAAQGTMNNLTFGNERYQYYETLAGGAGAGPGYDGASAVHTHMTNSRLTDPEILELRYPVRLRTFAIRHGSGGAGRHRGGDGVIRRIEFLEAMQVSLLANHRRVAPFGLAGGRPGRPGHDRLVRADGRIATLSATSRFAVERGDIIEIETPGGGGYGAGGE
jgi:5-oxoprolinase (ATP-hydrolysing)